MESLNQQDLILQELTDIFSLTEPADFNVTGYELYGRYKIAITSNYGMFSGTCIAEIVKLSKKYNFNFYISDTCPADIEGDFFLIIY